jgi:cytochrome c
MFRTSPILMSLVVLTACGSGDNAETNTASASTAIANMTSMERGRIMFKRCKACHTLDESGRHKIGPNLWGVFGQTAGAREDFNYSTAMSTSEITWDDTTMSGYLTRPSDYIPGNRMSYAGLRKEEDRLALIEYLRANTTASDG